MPLNLPLAARCAIAPESSSSERTQLLQDALLARLGDEKLDLRARIAAAEALSELGDRVLNGVQAIWSTCYRRRA